MDLQSPEKNDDKADSHEGITKVSSENIILLEDEYITPGKLKWSTQRAVYDAYISLIDLE